MSLTYIGKGRFIVGIPSEDLTDDEIAALAKRRDKTPAALRKELLDSGLYGESKRKESEK